MRAIYWDNLLRRGEEPLFLIGCPAWPIVSIVAVPVTNVANGDKITRQRKMFIETRKKLLQVPKSEGIGVKKLLFYAE
jgi:hypothetical protein